MFFGFNTEVDMRKALPTIIVDELVKRAEHKSVNVCTREKECVGSIDGKIYRYLDGSTDKGIMMATHKAELGGHTFVWSDEA